MDELFDFDGVKYDPLFHYRQLRLQSRGQLDQWIANQNHTDEMVRLQAEENLVNLTRNVFNNRTLLDSDILRLLDSFQEYCVGKGQRGKN